MKSKPDNCFIVKENKVELTKIKGKYSSPGHKPPF